MASALVGDIGSLLWGFEIARDMHRKVLRESQNQRRQTHIAGQNELTAQDIARASGRNDGVNIDQDGIASHSRMDPNQDTS